MAIEGFTTHDRDNLVPVTHEHTCRDCGMGYECTGDDRWNGCDLFDGSCGLCEVDNLTP